jgi:hypothetical protein
MAETTASTFTAPSREELEELTVTALKEELKRQCLDTKGVKADLVQRFDFALCGPGCLCYDRRIGQLRTCLL